MSDKPGEPILPKFRGPEEWIALLRERPISKILGIVAPAGVTGGKGRGQELWTLNVSFEAWKHSGGPVQRTKLVLGKTATDEELKDLRSYFQPYEIVLVHAKIAENPDGNRQYAALEKFIAKYDDDHELNHAAKELQKPVTAESVRFGQFTMDRLRRFQAKTDWCGARIRLILDVEKYEEVEESIRVAEKVWESQSEWDDRVRRFAVAELLPLKNRAWLGEDSHR